MTRPQTEPVAPPATYCGGAGEPTMPSPVTGVGGNTTIVNQNETAIRKELFSVIPVDYVGYQQDARVGGDV